MNRIVWPCACMKKDAEDAEDMAQAHKPRDNRLYQQDMKPCCMLVITTQKVVTLFVLTGLLCLPIGITLLVQSTEIFEYDVDYTDCYVDSEGSTVTGINCYDKEQDDLPCQCSYTNIEIPDTIHGDVKILYGLKNYYQNHRLYRQSQSFEQLLGDMDATCVSGYCYPYDFADNASQVPYYPKGAVANSFFTDTFELYKVDGTNKTLVALNETDISWKSDRTTKFVDPANFDPDSSSFSWPKDWQKWMTNGSPDGSFPELPRTVTNEHLINWMNPAAFPSFTKLYAKATLEPGKYTLTIKYRYKVHAFGGKKFVRLAETSWMGGRSRFLGIAYCMVGASCLIAAVFFAIISRKTRVKRQERKKKIDEQLVACKTNSNGGTIQSAV